MRLDLIPYVWQLYQAQHCAATSDRMLPRPVDSFPPAQLEKVWTRCYRMPGVREN